jgi:hypothetical protein
LRPALGRDALGRNDDAGSFSPLSSPRKRRRATQRNAPLACGKKLQAP